MKIGIIGMGNIGKAAAMRLIKCECDVMASSRKGGKFGPIDVLGDNKKIAALSDVIILAVKPSSVSRVVGEIKELLNGKILISIAAGIPLAFYDSRLGCAVFRVMSNIALRNGKATSLYKAGSKCTESDKHAVEAILSFFGSCVEVEDEALIDLHTAISGSSIAYLAYILSLFVESAYHSGMEKDMAQRIVLETTTGAIGMLSEENDWSSFIRKVASRGGTTEEGLVVLREAGASDIVENVISKTMEKCVEIRRKYGNR